MSAWERSVLNCIPISFFKMVVKVLRRLHGSKEIFWVGTRSSRLVEVKVFSGWIEPLEKKSWWQKNRGRVMSSSDLTGTTFPYYPSLWIQAQNSTQIVCLIRWEIKSQFYFGTMIGKIIHLLRSVS